MKPFVATFKIRQKVGDWFKMKNEDALCIKDDVHTHLDVSVLFVILLLQSFGALPKTAVNSDCYCI